MLAGVAWSSDSRQILTFSEMQIRATVWSLVEMTQTAFLRGPKLLPPQGLDFSTNGKFMCLAERRETKDWIAIYYAGHDWKLVNCFETNESFDVQDCKWVMLNTAILVQDSPLEPRFVVYSALTGLPIAIHKPQCSGGLAVRSLTLSPNAKMIACATYDTNLVLYNNLT
jgi:WD40 repeat protein